jgi:hypothetical protein
MMIVMLNALHERRYKQTRTWTTRVNRLSNNGNSIELTKKQRLIIEKTYRKIMYVDDMFSYWMKSMNDRPWIDWSWKWTNEWCLTVERAGSTNWRILLVHCCLLNLNTEAHRRAKSQRNKILISRVENVWIQ